MNKSEGTRIDLLLDKLDMSQAEFASALGVTTGAVGNWKKRMMGASVVNKIADTFPQVSREWLMTGEGEIFKNIIAQGYQSVFGKTPQELGAKYLIELYAERIKKTDELNASLMDAVSEVRSLAEELRRDHEEIRAYINNVSASKKNDDSLESSDNT